MSFSRAKSRLRRPPDKRPALLCYRLAPLVLFVSSILFLSRHLALNPKEPSSSEPFLEVDATTESCYKSVRSLTSSPSGQDHTFDPSPTFPRSKHVKRDQALLRRFGCLVNEGERFLEEGLVHATGRFSNSPQDFGNHPFRDNGWSEDTANDPNPWEWDEVLDSISGGMPPMEQIFHVRLSQDQLFNNAYHRNLPNTGAEYVGHYIPPSSLIIMTDTYSPRYWVGRHGVAEDQIVEHIPRLNTLSDAVWQVWIRLTDQPGSLRYYAVENIFNEVTAALIDYLLLRDRSRASIVTWEHRVTYGLDSDEGKALLATPNSIAVLWLLVHRRDMLGRRDPRVTIFNPGMSRRMIWEFIPPGQQSTFDDYRAANFSRPGRLGRRDLNSDLSPSMSKAISKETSVDEPLGQRWGYLIEKGKNHWEQGILPAFEGRSPCPTPQWTERDLVGDDALDTGWAWKDEPGKDLPAHWKNAFELIPEGNQAGQNQETSFVSLDHNGAFTNTQCSTEVPPTLGQYYTYILPNAGAIITTVAYSPESLLREYGVPPQDMPTRLPAVHRTSDVLWLVWQSYQYQPSRFRYFAAEDILNPVTKPLLDDIFLARRGTINVPWSRRLTFDLRSDEGKALLGSPNGSAVVWVLIHRAAVLGWREVRVSVFNPGGNMRCMIWDLVPIGKRAVFGEVEGR